MVGFFAPRGVVYNITGGSSSVWADLLSSRELGILKREKAGGWGELKCRKLEFASPGPWVTL